MKKIILEGEEITVKEVWKHYNEADEEMDYTVDYIDSEGNEKRKFIFREDYLMICKAMGWLG